MAAPDYTFLRNWIFHQLGDLKELVTGPEVYATIAEKTREIGFELEMDWMLTVSDETLLAATGYLELPAGCAKLEAVEVPAITGSTSPWWPEVVGYRELASRKYFDDNEIKYFYIRGNRIYPSWTSTTDIDMRLYYTPYLNEDFIVPGTMDFGDEGHMPAFFVGVLRYAVLSDLYRIHAKTQEDYFKAQQLEAHYGKLLDRAKMNVKKTFKRQAPQEIRNY